MSSLKALVTGLAGMAAAMVVAPSAMAVTWSNSTSPLVAIDGGSVRAEAYGNFFNYQGQSAHSSDHQYDPRPGGDKIYVETEFYWYGPNGSCGSDQAGNVFTCMWDDTGKQSPRSNVASWDFEWRARDLVANATQGRGAMKTCEDQSWSPDPCSAHAYATFSY